MYHISRHFLGHQATFNPQLPVSQNKSELQMAARVCGAETIENCFKSIKCCWDLMEALNEADIEKNGVYFFVYEFENTKYFTENKSVLDFHLTGEFISSKNEKAKLVSAFWVSNQDLGKGYAKHTCIASIDEAIENWDYQKTVVLKAESSI